MSTTLNLASATNELNDAIDAHETAKANLTGVLAALASAQHAVDAALAHEVEAHARVTSILRDRRKNRRA